MTDENISAIRARLKFKNIEDFARGYARYISSGGIFIPMAKDRLKPVGALIRFQFLLSDGATALLGEGRVHQVRATSSSGKAPVGMLVKFTKLSQTSKKLVETIVRAKKGEPAEQEPEEEEEEVRTPVSPQEEETSEGPAPDEHVASEPDEQDEHGEQEPKSSFPSPDVFGLSAGHSSLEEETRAGPSPNDVTPTKHLDEENQPPKADDAPTRDGEHTRDTSEQPAIIPPTNPFEVRADSNPSSPEAPALTPTSDDPPTREVQADDAQSTPTTEQDDPYAIDLFGDIDLGLNTPQSGQSTPEPEPAQMPSLFDDEKPDAEELAPQEKEESEPEEEEPVVEPEPQDEPAPEQDEVPAPDVEDEQEEPAEQEEEPLQSTEARDALVSDLVEASLSSLDAAQDAEAPEDSEPSFEESPEPSESEEESDTPADAPEEEEPAHLEVQDTPEEEVEPEEESLPDPVDEGPEATAEVEPEQVIEEDAGEPQQDSEPEEEPPLASSSRSLNAIKLPPPPTLKGPPAIPDLPGADDVDLDLIFGDDDDLLGDIMRPGLTATAKPLEIPTPVEAPEEPAEEEAPAEPDSQEPLATPADESDDAGEPEEDTPESIEDEDSDAIDLFDIVAPAASDDVPELKERPSSPRQLAQTEGGLQVLAYDDSTTFDHGLEALSVADDAEEIDLMFDGIFGGSGGESEDDIFGDMFNTQSLSAVSQADELPEFSEPIEEEEPSKELSNLLDNLETDEDEALGIDDLDLQGASFAEEDKPSEEEEEESLAALLESARQDIDKIQQHKQEEEGEDPGDALLANLLGDEALEAPAEEEVVAMPIPEPKKKEKKGLFSKLFGKDD